MGNPPKQKPSAVQMHNLHVWVVLISQINCDHTSRWDVRQRNGGITSFGSCWMTDVTIVNTWILFSVSPHAPVRRGYDQLSFRVDLAELPRAGFTSRKHVRGRRNATRLAVVDVANVEGHRPVCTQTKRGRAVCRQCSRAGRKTTAAYQIETSF